MFRQAGTKFNPVPSTVHRLVSDEFYNANPLGRTNSIDPLLAIWFLNVIVKAHVVEYPIS